ncbi:MAG: DUF2231 domain-containing protein [Calditrichaeota bacterium]|nr:DUF2231 domain-containing protein [Calditrichota bacterium]
MPELHALVVHFTIALLAVAVMSDFLYAVSRREKFHQLGRSLLILGTLAATAAVLTGWLAQNALDIPTELQESVVHHKWSGLITLGAFGVLCVLRYLPPLSGRWQQKPIQWVYYLVSVVGLVFLFRTGFLGGELVYKFGVGMENDSRKAPLIKPSFENEE